MKKEKLIRKNRKLERELEACKQENRDQEHLLELLEVFLGYLATTLGIELLEDESFDNALRRIQGVFEERFPEGLKPGGRGHGVKFAAEAVEAVLRGEGVDIKNKYLSAALTKVKALVDSKDGWPFGSTGESAPEPLDEGHLKKLAVQVAKAAPGITSSISIQTGANPDGFDETVLCYSAQSIYVRWDPQNGYVVCGGMGIPSFMERAANGVGLPEAVEEVLERLPGDYGSRVEAGRDAAAEEALHLVDRVMGHPSEVQQKATGESAGPLRGVQHDRAEYDTYQAMDPTEAQNKVWWECGVAEAVRMLQLTLEGQPTAMVPGNLKAHLEAVRDLKTKLDGLLLEANREKALKMLGVAVANEASSYALEIDYHKVNLLTPLAIGFTSQPQCLHYDGTDIYVSCSADGRLYAVIGKDGLIGPKDHAWDLPSTVKKVVELLKAHKAGSQALTLEESEALDPKANLEKVRDKVLKFVPGASRRIGRGQGVNNNFFLYWTGTPVAIEFSSGNGFIVHPQDSSQSTMFVPMDEAVTMAVVALLHLKPEQKEQAEKPLTSVQINSPPELMEMLTLVKQFYTGNIDWKLCASDPAIGSWTISITNHQVEVTVIYGEFHLRVTGPGVTREVFTFSEAASYVVNIFSTAKKIKDASGRAVKSPSEEVTDQDIEEFFAKSKDSDESGSRGNAVMAIYALRGRKAANEWTNDTLEVHRVSFTRLGRPVTQPRARAHVEKLILKERGVSQKEEVKEPKVGFSWSEKLDAQLMDHKGKTPYTSNW